MGLEKLWIVLIVCAALCAVGFYKYVYFLSIGYGLAVAGGAVAIALLFLDGLEPVHILLLALFIAYGVRLSGFLLVRELKNAAYRRTLTEVAGDEKAMPVFVKFAIWVSVAVLYTAQVSPLFYRLYNGTATGALPFIGAAVSLFGLVLEAVADRQKSAQKAVNPDMVATQGLYRLVRCPNYLGEIVFWTGVFVGALDALTGAVDSRGVCLPVHRDGHGQRRAAAGKAPARALRRRPGLPPVCRHDADPVPVHPAVSSMQRGQTGGGPMTVPMAIVDYIPVALFIAAAVLLQRDLYNKMSKGAFALFAAGTLMIMTAGLFKATWKLLYAMNVCDFVALNEVFLPMQAVGFLLTGAALIALLTARQGPGTAYAVAAAPLPYTSGMIFIVLMVLGTLGMCASLIVIAARMKRRGAAALFAVAFVFMLGMGYLSSRDFTQAAMNWIAQCTNAPCMVL